MNSNARERITDAYLEYLKLKPYNKIKVSDIIISANVNRSTFYRNFENIYSLFKYVCERSIHLILSDIGDIKDIYDIRKVSEIIFSNAMEHLDTVELLAGKNGTRKFLYELRNSYAELLREKAKKSGCYNEDVRYSVCFAADYLLTVLCYRVSANEGVIRTFSDVAFVYDFDANPVDMVAKALKTLNGGTEIAQCSIFMSIMRAFSKCDSRNKPISELLSYSGFSRSEFYVSYSHREDYFRKMIEAISMICVKVLLPLLISGDKNGFCHLTDQWEKYKNEILRAAAIRGMNESYAVDIAARIIVHVYAAYREYIENTFGRQLMDREMMVMQMFVCSVVCSFAYYFCDNDRDSYFTRIEKIFEFKELLKKRGGGEYEALPL